MYWLPFREFPPRTEDRYRCAHLTGDRTANCKSSGVHFNYRSFLRQLISCAFTRWLGAFFMCSTKVVALIIPRCRAIAANSPAIQFSFSLRWIALNSIGLFLAVQNVSRKRSPQDQSGAGRFCVPAPSLLIADGRHQVWVKLAVDCVFISADCASDDWRKQRKLDGTLRTRRP